MSEEQNTDIVTVPKDRALATPVGNGVHVTCVEEAITLGKVFAASGLYGEGNNPAICVVKILIGAEMGFGPAASQNAIYVVKGKAMMSGVAIATLVDRHPRYGYQVNEHTDEKCSITFYKDGKVAGTETFTKADADRAQTQNMSKFPRNMLWNRAMSNGAKFYCPDVFNGVSVYTEGEVIEDEPEPAPTGTIQRVADRIMGNNLGEHLSATGEEEREFQEALGV